MEQERREIEIYKKQGTHKDKGRKGFYSGVLALSLSAVTVKIIGLVFKIPMLRLLGSEGMGYFNSAYEIYALLCIISTSGLPVAMSVMISRENEGAGAERIFKCARRLFLLLGAVGTAIMLAFSYPLAQFLGNTKSFYAIVAIAPTLLFICIASAYRGYFQGQARMLPTAISQVIEALCKLILGLLFASLALNTGLPGEVVAACAVLGLLVGSALSALYLFLTKGFKGSDLPLSVEKDKRSIRRELLAMSVPITVSAALSSITKMVDMTMILRRLQSIGYSGEVAFSVYGSYTTLCLPLFSLAPALVGAVAMPILPRLSRAIAGGDKEAELKTVSDGISLTAMISMPISVGLALFSKEILELIFKGESEAITLCAPLLTCLALSVSLSSMITVTNASLQAYGHPSLPLVSMGVGAVIKTVLSFFLIGNESVNIMGAPISTLACDMAINILGFYFLCRYMPGKLKIGKILVRPFIASIISIVASRILYGSMSARYGEGAVMTVGAIMTAGVMYIIACLLLRVINVKEIKSILASK